MIFNKIKSLLGIKPKDLVQTGTIEKVFYNKGYGFIRAEKSNKKIFVHFSDVEKKIRVGNKVKFVTEMTDKGLKAKKVVKIS